MRKVVGLLDRVLTSPEDAAVIAEVRGEVNGWMSKFPLYETEVAATV